MATLTIRQLPEEAARALKRRARDAGTNSEAFARRLLTTELLPEERLKLGSLWAARARRAAYTDEDIRFVESTFDRTPAEPLDFT